MIKIQIKKLSGEALKGGFTSKVVSEYLLKKIMSIFFFYGERIGETENLEMVGRLRTKPQDPDRKMKKASQINLICDAFFIL